MSRVSYGDYWNDVASVMAMGRFEHNSRAVVRSKRGKKVLTRLRDALLAFPEKKLAYETFCEWDKDSGEINACVLGVYELSKGKLPSDVDWLNEEGADETVSQVADKDMTETLAWLLIDQNDEQLGHCTPSERYTRMLGIIEKWLAL